MFVYRIFLMSIVFIASSAIYIEYNIDEYIIEVEANSVPRKTYIHFTRRILIRSGTFSSFNLKCLLSLHFRGDDSISNFGKNYETILQQISWRSEAFGCQGGGGQVQSKSTRSLGFKNLPETQNKRFVMQCRIIQFQKCIPLKF